MRIHSIHIIWLVVILILLIGGKVTWAASEEANYFVGLCGRGDYVMVKAYIMLGTDINAANDQGNTPLMQAAARSNDPKVVSVLIEAGAKVDARQETSGYTPLMFALEGNENPNNAEIVQALIDGGADVNALTNDKWTPLMQAAHYTNNPEVIRVLLKAGGDAKYNLTGITAYSLAMENQALKGTDVLEVLKKVNEKSSPQPTNQVGLPQPASQTQETYQDSAGLFRVSLPIGSTLVKEETSVREYVSPDNGQLYLAVKDAASAIARYQKEIEKRHGQFQGESAFQISGINGKISVWSMVGNFQENTTNYYVAIIGTYEGYDCAAMIILPSEAYTQAQPWVNTFLTGFTFHSVSSSSPPSMTPETSITPLPSPVTITPSPSPTSEGLPGLETTSTPFSETVNTYRDPAGQFTLTLPAGFTFKTYLSKETSIGALYQAPDGTAILEVRNLTTLQERDLFIAQLTQGKTPRGESTVTADGKKGKVTIYTIKDTGGETVTLITTYPDVNAVLVITDLPVSQYQKAQSWLLPLFKGLTWTNGSPAKGNVYRDSSGVFTVTLPDSFTFFYFFDPGFYYNRPDHWAPPATGITGQTPGKGFFLIANFSSPETYQRFLQEYDQKVQVQEIQFHGSSTITAHGVSGKITLYSFTQGNERYVELITTYEETQVVLKVKLPASEYQAAGSWLLPFAQSLSWTLTSPSPSSHP